MASYTCSKLVGGLQVEWPAASQLHPLVLLCEPALKYRKTHASPCSGLSLIPPERNITNSLGKGLHWHPMWADVLNTSQGSSNWLGTISSHETLFWSTRFGSRLLRLGTAVRKRPKNCSKWFRFPSFGTSPPTLDQPKFTKWKLLKTNLTGETNRRRHLINGRDFQYFVFYAAGIRSTCCSPNYAFRQKLPLTFPSLVLERFF